MIIVLMKEVNDSNDSISMRLEVENEP